MQALNGLTFSWLSSGVFLAYVNSLSCFFLGCFQSTATAVT